VTTWVFTGREADWESMVIRAPCQKPEQLHARKVKPRSDALLSSPIEANPGKSCVVNAPGPRSPILALGS